MIKYHKAEIARLLQYEVCSRDLFNEYMNLLPEALTDIQKATRFIYILSQSFASKGNHFGYGTTSRPNLQIFATGHLKDVKERLRNTYIENLSFEEIFKRYERERTFFFCDPPYFETCGYKNPFTEEDHTRLCEILQNIKGKFLLTINGHTKVREWYKDF
ncbi:D12 class N6 adenine-specific DNA methyltransferase [Marinisporobacter balticus]|uniref:D12 class N6 adenine-specific DNA methyltransferase n=2 Tax=Marinisporobacter balticus TaxID=2018667 RepID=A0A4R2KYJ5_9FIRM|nr:D12 class N6 adenine-specific DNA methyltransferase [Marinisporobacter balticus]